MSTAPKSRAKSTPRATGPIALDLDSLERERTYEPFAIRVGGKRVVLIDPRDLDWQEAAGLSPERPFEFFDAVVPKGDQEAFFAARFPMWKMEELIQSYRAHYGMGDAGNSRG